MTKPRGQEGEIRTPCTLGCGLIHVSDRPVKPPKWTDLGFDERGEHLGFACPRHRLRKEWRVLDSSLDPVLMEEGLQEARRLEAVEVMRMRSDERDRLARERLEGRAARKTELRAMLAEQRAREKAAAIARGRELDAAARRAELAGRIRRRFRKAGAMARKDVAAFVDDRWPDMAVDERRALVAEVMTGGEA